MWGSLQSFIFQGSPAAPARNINYLPQCSDHLLDSDDDEQLFDQEAPCRAPDACLDTSCSREFAENALLGSEEERRASLRAANEAQELIYSFCSRTSITKVAPTEQELDTPHLDEKLSY